MNPENDENLNAINVLISNLRNLKKMYSENEISRTSDTFNQCSVYLLALERIATTSRADIRDNLREHINIELKKILKDKDQNLNITFRNKIEFLISSLETNELTSRSKEILDNLKKSKQDGNKLLFKQYLSDLERQLQTLSKIADTTQNSRDILDSESDKKIIKKYMSNFYFDCSDEYKKNLQIFLKNQFGEDFAKIEKIFKNFDDKIKSNAKLSPEKRSKANAKAWRNFIIDLRRLDGPSRSYDHARDFHNPNLKAFAKGYIEKARGLIAGLGWVQVKKDAEAQRARSPVEMEKGKRTTPVQDQKNTSSLKR